MAWTTPSTAVAGSTALTAAFWNQQVRDNVLASRVFFASAVDTAPRVYSSLGAGADTQVTSLNLPYAAKVADSLIVLQAQIHTSKNQANRVSGGYLTADGSIITAYQADLGGNRSRFGAGQYLPNGGGVATDLANVYMTAVYAPASTSSVTYGVKLYNGATSTQTLYLNQSSGDSNSGDWARTVSTLFLWEVAP